MHVLLDKRRVVPGMFSVHFVSALKNFEEPDSVTPIVRFCDGYGWQLEGLPSGCTLLVAQDAELWISAVGLLPASAPRGAVNE
jgi:hypothetical protein